MTTKITSLNIDTTTINSVGTLTSLTVSGTTNLGNLVTGNYFSGNGSLLTSIPGANITGSAPQSNTAGTVTTNAQPNITSVGTLANLTVTGNVALSGANVSLGSVGNLHITGGFANWVLSTDGAGSLSWTPQSTGGGGGSNASIVPAVAVNSFTANGSANTFALTSTPAAKSQTMVHLNGVYQAQGIYNLTGNVISFASNVPSGTKVEVQIVTPGTIANTVQNSNQPNITGVGILSNLTVSGNVQFQGANISLGAVSNVKVSAGSNGQYISTDGSGNLSFSTVSEPLHPFLLGGM